VIGFRQSHAVVIGIDEYRHGIPSLRTAVNDARRVAEVLETNFGYGVHLLDQDVTLGRLKALFDETLPCQLDADDRLLVYFAGHGIALEGEDGPAGYLIPGDARGDDRTTFLPMTELNGWLNRYPCRHFLLILDCCFAGAFRWSNTRELGVPPDVIHRERFDRYIRDPAWQVITSAAYDQKALDVLSGETIGVRGGALDQAAHSPFAVALLRGLMGEADAMRRAGNGSPKGDGVITATELYFYLRDCVEVGTDDIGHRQTPELWPLKRHDKGEFIHLVPGHELNLPPAPELNEANNPYRGLQSYDEEHAPLFFGRTKVISALADRVRVQPLTIVLGASGTGKSSVVKAGLLPQLRTTEPDGWRILPPIRPGKSPLASLASVALPGQDSNDLGTRLAEFRAQPEALASRISDWSAHEPVGRSLLVVDQLEELITLCRDSTERDQFLRLLEQALKAEPDRLRVVLTVRSDFEPQFADCPLRERWLSARVVVPAMTLDEYRESIEGPASAKVLYFQGKASSQAFIARLIDDVANTPGALPLLSFTLSELYRRYHERGGNDRSLSEEDYEQLGGVGGSLRNRADEIYQALPDDASRATLRRVVLRMVSVEGGEMARRRVPDDELVYEQQSETARVADVLHRLTDARLVVEGTDDDGRPFAEPAHDALIRGWGKLLVWSREGLEELQLRRRLTPAASEWSSGRGGLWIAEPRLGVLKLVSKHRENWLNAVEARFVRRSIAGRRNAILGACGAISLLVGLLLVAGLLIARYYRNLPNERLYAARTTLTGLGFRVTDENGDHYRVVWESDRDGPMPEDAWLDAAGPLRTIDRYRTIESIELIFTDVAHLTPLSGMTGVKHLKVLGSRAIGLAPIAHLRSLDTLELGDFRSLEDGDLKVLQNFRGLINLYLGGCEKLTDRGMEHLAGLPIGNLVLSDCKRIGNAGCAALRDLPLEQLMINRTKIRVDRALVDLLLRFPRLISVNVSGLPADKAELDRLRTLGQARGLQVSPAPRNAIVSQSRAPASGSAAGASTSLKDRPSSPGRASAGDSRPRSVSPLAPSSTGDSAR
jgi:hypothetical protein